MRGKPLLIYSSCSWLNNEMHYYVIKEYLLRLSVSIYCVQTLPTKMPGSLTFTPSFRIKPIAWVALTAARITNVSTYMITSSVVCFTWITLHLLATTQDVRAAVTPTMSWGRTVTVAVSGLNPIFAFGIDPASWAPRTPFTIYWR